MVNARRLVVASLATALVATASRAAHAQSAVDPWTGQAAPAPVQPLTTAPPPPALDVRRMLIFNDQQRSPWAALAIELVPGCGSVYGDDLRGALLTWGLIAGGMMGTLWGASLTATNIDGGRESAAAMPLVIGGLAMAVFGRGYGFVNAYRATGRYNAALRTRLGLPPEETSPSGGR